MITRQKISECPVTVILVVKNGETYIRSALESVFGQTSQPNEILVIDGGSTDATLDIAQSFSKVEVIHQVKNGIAEAYNLGIQSAKTDLVAFISHDDIWENEKLAIQTEFMLNNPSLEFSVTRVQHFLEDGHPAPAGFRTELLEEPRVGMIMETLMARKTAFKTVGWFDPSFNVGEDTDWFARAKDSLVPYAVIPDVLVRKRVHGGNATLSNENTNELLMRVIKQKIARRKGKLNR